MKTSTFSRIVSGLALALVLPNPAQAQVNCNAGLTATPQTVNCGNRTISFNGFLVATKFDFNTGTLPAGWSSSPYTVGQPCIENSPDNTNYFWATTLQSGGPMNGRRFVQTSPVNVTAGGNIVFKMRYGTDDPKNANVAGCEDPDLIAEGVFLQYSINGGTSFTNINLPNQPNGRPWNEPNGANTGPLYDWTTYTVTIPAAAQTNNVIFRWAQNSNSGTQFDNWGLEDIIIQAAPASTPTYSWNFGDGNTASTQSPSHTYATAGTYTVGLTISFPSCTATASTVVNVIADNTLPTITATGLNAGPFNTSSDGAGNCSTTANIGTPTATDNCTVSSVVASIGGNPINPATYAFPAGTTVVRWTATDNSGNQAFIDQNVTVVDNENPTITAPAAVSVSAGGNCQASGVALGTASVSDNCTIGSATNNAPASFPLGTTTVTWSITDGGGNTATATQLVTVTDNTAPVIATFTTPASPVTVSSAGRVSTWTNVQLNGSGNVIAVDPGATVTLSGSWTSAYDGGGGCTGCVTQHYLGLGTTTITCRSMNPDGSPSGSGPTFSDAFTAPTTPGVYYISQVGMWCYNCGDCLPASYPNTATDAVAVIIVRTPVCHDDVTVNNAPGICGAPVNYVTPSVVDNCPGATLVQTAGLADNSTFAVGTTTNTFSAADASNNTASCSFNVIVIDTELPTITAPANVTVNTDAGLCQASGVVLGTPVTGDNCTVSSVSSDAPAIFPKGTTVVTWTVTDNHGNSATATQNVLVIDNENPTVTAPAAVNANADAGQCYATITQAGLGTPVFGDNCPGSSVSNNAPANNQYPVGNTTVIWTATDADNHITTANQTVTVTDAQNPTITAPANVTVATDANLCSATGVALGTPVTGDNCAVASVTNDAPATFPKGSTTVTWTVRDVNNNTATATQTVLVEDRQNPAITAPANVTTTTSADGTGNCSTTATLGTPASSDNCGVTATTAKVGSMTINPATYAFPTGTTTVTWTASDAAGNTASATQTVTVTDNEQPAINCPANVAQCFNASGNNVALSVTSGDNCGVTSTTYAITGATTGTGTGSSFNRTFAVGTSTVTWTVKDAANNSRSCSMTVLIRPLPTVTIASSGADEFCNATTLTASIAPAGTATYAWTYNNAPFASTQTVKLKLSNGDGAYRVVATDVYGCSSAPAVYNFAKQTLVNMYVLLGMKEVDLAQNNDVINGSVGVTSSHGEADFDKYCSVTSPGSFVKAVDINTKNPVTITTKIYSQAVVTLPTMYVNTSNPSSLSNYVMTTNGTVSGNKKDLTINSNKTVTVTGNIFRKIRICHGANVTFTASDISIESLNMDQGSTVSFTSNTKVRVSDEVDVAKECSINPTAKIVTFYVKDPSAGSYNCWGNWSSWHSWLGGSSEKFIVDGKSTNIIANVYVPNGKIRVHGNGWNCWWNQYESCNMMGLFIAEEIQGDGKNISWYSYDCATPASFRQAAHTAPIEEAADFGVMMYPNPTSGQFSLQFSNTADAATVRITDIQGRLISTRTVEVGEMPSAAFSIEGQAAGVYLVEIHQGAKTVRNKIVLR